MTIVPSGKVLNFDYTAYDSASTLPAGMRIYNITTSTPVLVTTVAMAYVFGGSYTGTYTFPASTPNQVYLIHKAIYTDNTYNTLVDTYSPGSETIQVDGFDSRQGNAI